MTNKVWNPSETTNFSQTLFDLISVWCSLNLLLLPFEAMEALEVIEAMIYFNSNIVFTLYILLFICRFVYLFIHFTQHIHIECP